MATPTDPLYTDQWHFPLLGDIETIWDDYSGDGVKVGVYDDGVDYNHEDLDGNYDASLHVVDDLGNTVDPFPVGDNAHGTACAGLIGAEANNGAGGVGVASGVSLTGVNIFDPNTYGYVNGAIDPFMDVAHQATKFDISSNSWGSTPGYQFFQNLTEPTGFAGRLEAEYDHLSMNGRGGLGTIVTQAAGNDNLNANGSGTNASRYTVTVAATDANGDAQSYTNFGSSILVAAPAGAVTTDISGAPGYDAGDYTFGFGGTSAATPITSGVIALMLEADSNLGWRDVHNILSNSASLTGSAIGGPGTGSEDGAWFTTTAGNWNGGGHSFHPNYGFGMVDAFAAVRMAEVWDMLHGPTPATSANNEHVMAASGSVGIPTVNEGTITHSITVTEDISIEDIQVTVDMDFSYAGPGSPIEIFLIAPDGTRFMLTDQESSFNAIGGLTWEYGITGGLGMASAGDWTIEITDIDAFGDTGTLNDWRLDFHGAAQSSDDVHHFTEDYQTMVAHEGGRGTVTDSNGGTDWLNFAAIADAMSIDLSAGDFGTLAPGAGPMATWGSLSGVFENVVTGDGDDTILGNGEDNTLSGMRGNDMIEGRNGFDTLYGGAGDDELHGGAQADTLFGGIFEDELYGDDGNDRLYGEAGFDLLVGGAGDDMLSGGAQADRLFGGIFEDELYGGDGKDRLFGGDGNDIGYGGEANDSLFGEGDDDHLYGQDGNDSFWGGRGNDILDGGNGDDVLRGGADFDVLVGSVGNDSLYGNFNADDFVFADFGGGFGQDTIFDFEATNDFEDIDLARVSAITDFADLSANHMSQQGADVLIDAGGGNTITLINVNIADLDAADFLF